MEHYLCSLSAYRCTVCPGLKAPSLDSDQEMDFVTDEAAKRISGPVVQSMAHTAEDPSANKYEHYIYLNTTCEYFTHARHFN